MLENTQTAKLVLVRGLPGSGKSTFARSLIAQGYVHLETDMFFMNDGKYDFRSGEIKIAHKWCQDTCRRLLESGQKVVVSNTFVKQWELAPYRAMCSDNKVMTMTGSYKNVHDVPVDVLIRMKENWEF